MLDWTHGIELVDCCDEFAHLVSNDTGQMDKRTLCHARHHVSIRGNAGVCVCAHGSKRVGQCKE